MFVAINAEDNSRVTSLASRWNNQLGILRRLASGGRLVCPGCKQPLWLRVGKTRRRHFAHRSLSDCPLAQQSAEVLEAKAQLFGCLVGKYPDRVHVDIQACVPGLDRRLDLVVKVDEGRQFGYWIFDRQQRFRDGFFVCRSLPGMHVHFIHTSSTLKVDPKGRMALTASQRDFIARSRFDVAAARHGGGHLHFLLEETSEIRVYRGLHRVHPPNLYRWVERRKHPLSQAMISPGTGEIVFAEDVLARQAWKDEQARIEQERRDARRNRAPVIQPRTDAPPVASVAIKERLSPGQRQVDGRANLNGPFRCEDCGIMTTAWSQAKPAAGTCVCRSCVINRSQRGP